MSTKSNPKPVKASVTPAVVVAVSHAQTSAETLKMERVLLFTDAVFAIMWNTHLRRYRYLIAVDGALIAGNVLQLLLVGLIPFATSMIARSATPIVVTFYAGALFANVVIGWLVWLRAVCNPALASPAVSAAVLREGNWRSGIAAAIFAGSKLLAWTSPVWAMCSWALQIPANRILQRFLGRGGAKIA